MAGQLPCTTARTERLVIHDTLAPRLHHHASMPLSCPHPSSTFWQTYTIIQGERDILDSVNSVRMMA